MDWLVEVVGVVWFLEVISFNGFFYVLSGCVGLIVLLMYDVEVWEVKMGRFWV